MKRALVVGSGLAGLATAIRLAVKNYQVSVFEANSYPGGKVTEITSRGYRFDAGPSLFTMPQFVDELFELAGKNPRDYFNYHKKELNCRYFWEDGTELSAWNDVDKFANDAAEATGVSVKSVQDYLASAAKTYQATAPVFLEKSLHKFQNYLSRDTLKAMASMPQLGLTSTLNKENETKLGNSKMVQLFNRYATYNGSSPYLTPGVMSIIPHLEFNIGTFYPEGGIHAITQSLFELATELGVDFHFNEKVEEILISKKKVTGARTSKQEYEAPLVISNADVVPSYRNLLPGAKAPEKTLNQPRSSSALIFYWGIADNFPQLNLHNIFFSENYREEFDYIFEKGAVYHDPTVYVNITSKEDRGDAPHGSENWFVMVNVPPNTGQDWDEIITETRKNVIAKLKRMMGIDIEARIETEELLEPRSIESKTSSYQGALYGASSNNTMAAFLRHPNFSSKIKGLYFCGGSVHPGGGIPLVLLSAKITSDLISR